MLTDSLGHTLHQHPLYYAQPMRQRRMWSQIIRRLLERKKRLRTSESPSSVSKGCEQKQIISTIVVAKSDENDHSAATTLTQSRLQDTNRDAFSVNVRHKSPMILLPSDLRSVYPRPLNFEVLKRETAALTSRLPNTTLSYLSSTLSPEDTQMIDTFRAFKLDDPNPRAKWAESIDKRRGIQRLRLLYELLYISLDDFLNVDPEDVNLIEKFMYIAHQKIIPVYVHISTLENPGVRHTMCAHRLVWCVFSLWTAKQDIHSLLRPEYGKYMDSNHPNNFMAVRRRAMDVTTCEGGDYIEGMIDIVHVGSNSIIWEYSLKVCAVMNVMHVLSPKWMRLFETFHLTAF